MTRWPLLRRTRQGCECCCRGVPRRPTLAPAAPMWIAGPSRPPDSPAISATPPAINGTKALIAESRGRWSLNLPMTWATPASRLSARNRKRSNPIISGPAMDEMNGITISSVSKFSLFIPSNESNPTSMNNRNRIMTSAVLTPTRIASRASCGGAFSPESLLRKFPRESNREGFVRTVFSTFSLMRSNTEPATRSISAYFFSALGNMLKGGANRNLRAHPLYPKNV